MDEVCYARTARVISGLWNGKIWPVGLAAELPLWGLASRDRGLTLKRAADKVSRSIHRDKRLAAKRVYRAAHREQLNAIGKVYRAAHREQLNAIGKVYRDAHRTCNGGVRRPAASREERLMKRRARYIKNRPNTLATYQAYRDGHRAEAAAYARIYYATHPDQVRAGRELRRDRMAGVEHNMTPELRASILREHGHCCAFCREPFKDGDVIVWDHGTPLTSNAGLVLGNAFPSHQLCNGNKYMLTVVEFLWRRAKAGDHRACADLPWCILLMGGVEVRVS